jgi:hypothetical protein
VNHDACAETCRVDVGAAATGHQTPIGIHKLVIGLEQADRRMMIESRRFIIGKFF